MKEFKVFGMLTYCGVRLHHNFYRIDDKFYHKAFDKFNGYVVYFSQCSEKEYEDIVLGLANGRIGCASCVDCDVFSCRLLDNGDKTSS